MDSKKDPKDVDRGSYYLVCTLVNIIKLYYMYTIQWQWGDTWRP
jgi:hypothetical protein